MLINVENIQCKGKLNSSCKYKCKKSNMNFCACIYLFVNTSMVLCVICDETLTL